MYLNPLFPEDEIKKEKGVIIEEIRMYKDRPDRQVHEALEALLYGDQPAGWTVLGPEENIRAFNREIFSNIERNIMLRVRQPSSFPVV
jgi:predicted Zn-dependent peptidase